MLYNFDTTEKDPDSKFNILWSNEKLNEHEKKNTQYMLKCERNKCIKI